jgi:hypothetical protein
MCGRLFGRYRPFWAGNFVTWLAVLDGVVHGRDHSKRLMILRMLRCGILRFLSRVQVWTAQPGAQMSMCGQEKLLFLVTDIKSGTEYATPSHCVRPRCLSCRCR